MGIEIANYISELDSNNPLVGDFVSEGDDHIRLLKKVIKQSFPNVDATVKHSNDTFNSVIDNIDLSVIGTMDFNNSSVINVGAVNSDNAIEPRSYYDNRYVRNNIVLDSDITLANNTGKIVLTKVDGTTIFTALRMDSSDVIQVGGATTPMIIKGANIDLAEGTQLNSIDFVNIAYPIGTIYTNSASTLPPSDPSLLGFGTWSLFGEGRVLISKSTGGVFDTLGETGGLKRTTLSGSDMPKHTHTVSTVRYYTAGAPTNAPNGPWKKQKSGGQISSVTGNGLSHNNLQPYITSYRWIRTA